MDGFSHGHDMLPETRPVSFSVSDGFDAFLAAQNITIAATSYQSGRLYLAGRHPAGGLVLSEEYFSKAMGLHVHADDLYLLADRHLVHLTNTVAEGNLSQGLFNKSFVPAAIHPTGDINGHDLAMAGDGRMIFVNTRSNCLSTLTDDGDVAPVWSPAFLNGVQLGDRCHLNGLAIDGGASAYVTGMARSCKVNGWRRHRVDGGFIMDVQSNRVVAEGLSMPHSPRVHDGELWVCNSGTGELGVVDRQHGRFLPFAFFPGFIRGLAFHGNYAFVGLSRPRHARFDGLPLHARLAEDDLTPWTGIQIIDTTTAETVAWFRIEGPVSELYDVAVLPGVGCAVANGMLPQFYTPTAQDADLPSDRSLSA